MLIKKQEHKKMALEASVAMKQSAVIERMFFMHLTQNQMASANHTIDDIFKNKTLLRLY